MSFDPWVHCMAFTWLSLNEYCCSIWKRKNARKRIYWTTGRNCSIWRICQKVSMMHWLIWLLSVCAYTEMDYTYRSNSMNACFIRECPLDVEKTILRTLYRSIRLLVVKMQILAFNSFTASVEFTIVVQKVFFSREFSYILDYKIKMWTLC